MSLVTFKRPELAYEINVATATVAVARETLSYIVERRSDVLAVRAALGARAKSKLLSVLDEEITSLDQAVDEAEEFLSAWEEICATLTKRTADS